MFCFVVSQPVVKEICFVEFVGFQFSVLIQSMTLDFKKYSWFDIFDFLKCFGVKFVVCCFTESRPRDEIGSESNYGSAGLTRSAAHTRTTPLAQSATAGMYKFRITARHSYLCQHVNMWFDSQNGVQVHSTLLDHKLE